MSESTPPGETPQQATPSERNPPAGTELPQASREPSGGAPQRAGTPVRVVALVLSFILAFVVAVAVVAMLDVGELTPWDEATRSQVLAGEEFFDGTASEKTRTMIFGWIGSGFGVLAIIAALNLALTGRGRRTFAGLTAATLAFFALSLVL